MNQNNPEFYAQDDGTLYEVGVEETQAIDIEQVNQFQPEFETRSTTSALTDLYTSSQIESHRYRDQGDPNEYNARFEDQ